MKKKSIKKKTPQPRRWSGCNASVQLGAFIFYFIFLPSLLLVVGL